MKLSDISTADLVRELAGREDVETMVVPPALAYLSRYWTYGLEEPVKSVGGTGPATVLVVRGEQG